ncbi:ABC-type transport auxiliary lipoprotein family protein [Sandarakinorhabdus sp.]|uniref:ABC-type transport auxiliary lipoprotein family protein n=1 Tax=Sandarakinorhabdus sp. TaxID=1916663 RepID=UPI00286D93B6|nr:ABC-type transport auxiliary lipoprotein family protein [Sandarakinorhabdus sp.]
MNLRLIPIALLLAACSPLVQVGGNAPAPASLLVLRADAPPPEWRGPAAVGDTLAVAVPDVPAELQTLRLPVQLTSATVQYLTGASWSEQPNRQFQRLLADTLVGAGVAVLDTRSGGVAPARQLTGHLREFGLDVRGTPMVRVRYDAQLAGPRGAGTVALRSFVAEEKVSSQQPAVVAAALNRAANRLAGEVAAWARG